MCRDANAMRENHYGKYGDKMQNLYDMNHLVYFKRTNEVKKKKSSGNDSQNTEEFE